MAQTHEGAMKANARRLGMALADYLALVDAGNKRCTKCKEWKPATRFSVDRSRGDGLAAKCRQCNSHGNYPDHMTKSDRIKAGWLGRRPTFVPPLKGKKMSDEGRRKISEAKKGRPSGRLGKKHTPETRRKISIASKERTPRGEQHYAFSHGRFQRDQCDRRTTAYKEWRDAVYKRDRYACKACGDSRGGNLNAHHVKAFASHPELRFDVDNGVTLCEDCHERLHLKPDPTPRDLARRKKHRG